ncbi:hypothetical protein [Thermosulfurimonas dismutans]|uniref:Uncharacterized protein n=1 Tax=Thermosulfurimonas dismutans TaxID=999894 RepID=A0A179D222_9BACT|nr:hypothetical protein [Thermosulfurimonas dismutans]OAQ19841.1 hypothetical protein TDIS_2059 [Thermosulfurimonas dismutans]
MLNKQQIINDLKKLDMDDYRKIIIEFVDEFKYPKITLYSFGNLKHPSISDLDLVIVYDDRLDDSFVAKIVEKAKKFVVSNEVKKYVFTHDILIYPKSIFRKIKFLHTFQNMKLLCGKEVDILVPSEEEQSIVDKVHFINFTYNALFWLKGIRLQKKVYLRQTLLTLNSVRHSFVFLKKIYQDSNLIKWIDILGEVRQDYSLIYKISFHELEEIFFEYLQKFLARFLRKWIDFSNLDKLINKKILVLHGRRMIAVPSLSIIHGASYCKCCPENKQSIYWKIHRSLYPINNFTIKDRNYKGVLRHQMEAAMEFEVLYRKFRIKPLIPLMCNYCTPVMTKKQKIRSLLNSFVVKIQLL